MAKKKDSMYTVERSDVLATCCDYGGGKATASAVMFCA